MWNKSGSLNVFYMHPSINEVCPNDFAIRGVATMYAQKHVRTTCQTKRDIMITLRLPPSDIMITVRTSKKVLLTPLSISDP